MRCVISDLHGVGKEADGGQRDTHDQEHLLLHRRRGARR